MMIGTERGPRDRVRDQRIDKIVELASPATLLAELPLGEEREQAVVRGRDEVVAALRRDDDRLIVVVGPCSVHDADAALDYAGRLAAAAERNRDDLLIVMRVYFEKPRTTVGWKGLINDPHLDGTCDVNAGLRMARAAAARDPRPRPADRLRVPRPDHAAVHLRPRSPGARSAPARPRARSTASSARGLSMPIGFKNSHRRQRPGRGRRRPRRRRLARVRRHRRRRHPGDPSTPPATPTAT